MMKKFILLIVLLTGLGLTAAGCGGGKATDNAQGGTTPQTSLQLDNSQQTIPNQQTTAMPNSIVFNWGDLQSDKVGPQGLAADGKPDGRFHVTMDFPEAVKIKYIIMRYTEFNRDIQWEWVYSTGLPTTGAPLAVFQNNTQVVQGTDTGLACTGAVDLDLYVPELNNEKNLGTFKFAKGQKLSVQINYVTQSGEEKEFDATATVAL